MAIPIRFTPQLESKAARRFIKEAQANELKKHTIPFHKELSIMDKILEKSNL